jgi:hypothetical protein
MKQEFNESFPGNYDLPYIANCSKRVNKPSFDLAESVFRDQENRLIEIINEYKEGYIFGCVAWLTSFPILKALSNCKNVQVIVQKEDFLRPDSNTKDKDAWKIQLQKMYNSVTCSKERHSMRLPIRELSVCSDPTVDGIRCVGNYNHDRNPAFPRMHNKFMVFCRSNNDFNNPYLPIAVWTGSFNFTKNATNSYENNLYLVDESGENEIISSYMEEHHLLFCISEPLNWATEWWQNEYRFGT